MINWRSKEIEREKGLVADFCNICRCPRSFKLVRIGQGAAFGDGVLVGFVIKCTVCQMRFTVDPARYLDLEQDRAKELASLIEKTFPRFSEIYAGRLSLEEQICRTPARLPPEIREDLLMEPFHLINPIVEARYSPDEFSTGVGIGCLGTTLFTVASIFVSIVVFGGLTAKGLLASALIGLILGSLLTTIPLHFAPKRHLRLVVIPLLARALEPLEPTEADLARIIGKCRNLGLKIGEVLTVAELWRELRRRAATHETPYKHESPPSK
jgi:hypothetical protein